jgi:hypothetical protein
MVAPESASLFLLCQQHAGQFSAQLATAEVDVSADRHGAYPFVVE